MTARKSDFVNYVVGVIVTICAFLAVRAVNQIDEQYKEQNAKLASIESKLDNRLASIDIKLEGGALATSLQSERLTKLASQIERRVSRLEEKVDGTHPQSPLEVKNRKGIVCDI